MYHFSFWPRFFYQKQLLLAQKEIPDVPLPTAAEVWLNPTRTQVRSLAHLWWICTQAIFSFLLQSLLVCALASVFAVGATLAGLEFLKPNQSPGYLVEIAFIYFFANIFCQVCTFFNATFRSHSRHIVQAVLINLISQKMLRMSSRVAARQSIGNLKVLITSDTLQVGEFVDNAVRNFIPAIISLAIILPILYRFSGKAGLVGVLVMIGFLPISLGLNKISSAFQMRGQGALDSLASLLSEWIKNIRLIRYLSWCEAFQKDILLRLRRYIHFAVAQHLMACLIFGLSVSWWMVSVLAVIWIARQGDCAIDLKAFFASIWLITFLSGFFTHLPNTIRLLGLAAPSMNRIFQLLRSEEQRDLLLEDGAPHIDHDRPTHVIFEDVSFSYDGAESVIRNLSATFSLDRKTAIIGQIAMGKTTFLRLLCGELPPTAGKIWIQFESGVRRDLWTTSGYDAYRRHLAWVPQEPFVSCDPLASNISLISTEEDSQVVEAAYWAELATDMSRFPNGIHEEVGEGGVNLSGGQKQRLNLARAYYANRQYLVLDDPLSAVDPQTEVALMKRLEDRSRGFVLVTHRVAELSRVQEVFTMKEGRFIECGDPQELMKNSQSEFYQVLTAYQGSAHA